MIQLTQAAAQFIGRQLSKKGQYLGLRLGVKTTGCSGLAYKIEYCQMIEPSDCVFEYFGIKVITDPKSLSFLDGTIIDYEKEQLKEGLSFKNPQEKDKCGCGESFRVK